ncbi:MAG: serine--tRNA ligase [Mariprofundales bacterium]
MIDRQQLRRDAISLQSALARRNQAASNALDDVIQLDLKQRSLKTITEQLQAERNKTSKAIGYKKAKGEDAASELAAMKTLSATLKAQDIATKAAVAEFEQALLYVPNPPLAEVPTGADEANNIELRSFGSPRGDKTPAHWDIGTSLGIIDFDAGVKLSGSRFSVLRGIGARLERALIQLMLDTHSDVHGYEEIWPPAIVRSEVMQGTGQLPKFADDAYKLEGEDSYLIPTAEVPITNLYRESIIDAAKLPIRHCAYTPCFRREAGSAGRDMRGLIRQHQFDKVELVQLVHPENALQQLEELTGHAEAILQKLGLPYRVMELCTGDLGFSAEKTLDLEVWFPEQQCYREISSCSSFGSFQARRAAIRMRNKGEKPQPVATINGSGVAVGRTLAAILENGYQNDGSVSLPAVLIPYMSGISTIKLVS